MVGCCVRVLLFTSFAIFDSEFRRLDHRSNHSGAQGTFKQVLGPSRFYSPYPFLR